MGLTVVGTTGVGAFTLTDPEITYNTADVTWDFNDPNITAYGYFDYGGMYIVVPSGSATVTRSNISPAPEADGETHGLMKNPPVDDTWSFSDEITGYQVGNNITTSATVSANDVLVLGVGDTTRNRLAGLSVVHVLASAPPANAICPPVFGYDGTSARPMHTIDIPTAAAALPTFDYTGLFQLYSITQTMGLVRSIEPFVAATGPLEFHRRRHGVNADGYGLDQANLWARVMHAILNNATTAAQREALLGWFMTNACTWDYAMQQGSIFATDGGWGQGAIAGIKLFRKLTSQSLATSYNMNELVQPMIIDASLLSDIRTPHNGTAGKPGICRRQTVTAVSGLDVTITGTGIDNSSNTDYKFTGTKLVRESDSTEANVVAESQSTANGAIVLTLETSNPFSVDDVVYATDRQGFVVGDITWGLRGRTTSEGLDRYSPSPAPRYSQLQSYDTLMFLASMGTDYVDDELLPALKWMQIAQADNIPATGDHTTTPYGDYPEVIKHGSSGGGANNTGLDFYNAYGSTAVDAAITALEA